jgi:hypothetical protein
MEVKYKSKTRGAVKFLTGVKSAGLAMKKCPSLQPLLKGTIQGHYSRSDTAI